MTSNNSPTDPRSLYTIDPVTGDGTLVGGTVDGPIADISFAANGTLFAWSEDKDDLATIDLTTGVATPVADSTLSTAGSGLAFDGGGSLFFAGVFDGAPDPNFATIDPVTGLVITNVGPLTPLLGDRVGALAFHPATDVLFALDKNTGTDTTSLATVDPSTAAVTQVGATETQMDALAFAPLCGDGATDAPWETCDDGNTLSEDGCSATCLVEVCGDGLLQTVEECDDGNTVDGDGCSALCEVRK